MTVVFRAYNDLMYGDNPGFTSSPGDTGGVYPDAYFAYQEYVQLKEKVEVKEKSACIDR